MAALARQLGFFALVIYGIGDILGAGIYALVGKVIGLAGISAWVTFLLAALVALITGFSYAELTARFPVSAGAAAYVRRAFPGSLAATIIGVIVLGTGLTSSATVTVAFSHYLIELTQGVIFIPAPLAQILLIFSISFLSFWGIQESSRVNFFLTFIEISGLLAVILIGAWLMDRTSIINFVHRSQSEFDFPAVLSGVTIAFYAYIGFEDLANLAEECKNPSQDLPRAILIAISVATFIYILVTLALQCNISQSSIVVSKTPLLLVFEKAGLHWILKYFSLIAILAITNTGLINLIMTSRLMYGMSQERLLPNFISKVHERRRTPWVGVLVSLIAVLFLVFTGGLKVLAQTTSLLIIVVFLFVHLSLIRVKWKGHKHAGIQFPFFLPVLGTVLCLTTLSQFQDYQVWLRSSILIGIGFVFWMVQSNRGSVFKFWMVQSNRGSVFKAFAWLIGAGLVLVPFALDVVLNRGPLHGWNWRNGFSVFFGVVLTYLWPWMFSDYIRIRSGRTAALLRGIIILNVIYWILFAVALAYLLLQPAALTALDYLGVGVRSAYAVLLVVITFRMVKVTKRLVPLTIATVCTFGVLFTADVVFVFFTISEQGGVYKFLALPIVFASKMFHIVHCIALGGLVYTNKGSILEGVNREAADDQLFTS